MNLLWYVGAFAVALGLLIVVHEFGHYLVARWCGVKVLRFSVGFGRAIVTRVSGVDRTEWALAAFPLGGYVKMLDEREAPVAPHELHRAFNRQPVGKRFAIVAAGPIANFVLAIALYCGLYSYGVEELRPLLGTPAAESPAARAGFENGELVRSINGNEVVTWQDLRWHILHSAFDRKAATLEVIDDKGEIAERRIELDSVSTDELEGDMLQQLGLRLYRPELPPVIGRVTEDSPAAKAGLQRGDRVVEIEGKPISQWSDLVAAVRETGGREIELVFVRDGGEQRVRLMPTDALEQGKHVGRIGVAVDESGFDRSRLVTTVRYGPVESLQRAVQQTWDTSVFSLAMMGRMLIGEVSWKNLSGPVTIADYAGQSAKLGLSHYIKFLALISISLGVLNLLPIPILDGGHLMYYIVEVIKGGPVSEKVMEIGQQIGLALLVMLMAFAFYNDINRLFSG